MKNALRKMGDAARNRYAQAGVGFSLIMAAGAANATTPTAAQTAMTSLQTEGEAMIDAAWPVVTALTVGFIAIKLFKKSASKAT